MPGAEFRVAKQHCDRVPGCNTVLGDRKLSVTLSRMFRLMSPYEKVKFIGSMLWDSISSITSGISNFEIIFRKKKFLKISKKFQKNFKKISKKIF